MNRKLQIQELWRTCFDDSEEFIQLFFDRIYKEENAITIEKKGKVISALQMIPYTMHWYNIDIPVSYIYAACTTPAERGKGIMQELLLKSIKQMQQQGIWATILIPANPSLFEYYRKQGYTEAFDYSLQTYVKPVEKPAEKPYTIIRLTENYNEEWYTYFNQKLKERPVCILHNQEDFQTLILDFYNAQGEVVGILDENNTPAGLAFYTPYQERSIFLKELVYSSENTKKALLWELTHHNNAFYAYYPTPASSPDTHRLGMGMVLNREPMIQHWLQQQPYYRTEQELKKMDNQSLTSLLFGYSNRDAYISLMMD